MCTPKRTCRSRQLCNVYNSNLHWENGCPQFIRWSLRNRSATFKELSAREWSRQRFSVPFRRTPTLGREVNLAAPRASCLIWRLRARSCHYDPRWAPLHRAATGRGLLGVDFLRAFLRHRSSDQFGARHLRGLLTFRLDHAMVTVGSQQLKGCW